MQAVQALGDKALEPEELHNLRAYLLKASRTKIDTEVGNDSLVLPQTLVDKTLKNTQFVTSWIARNIRQVLLGASKTQESNDR